MEALVFVLMVEVNGVAHFTQSPIYFNSIITCGEYANWIEATGERTRTPEGYEKQTIYAWCLPEIVNKKEVKVWE